MNNPLFQCTLVGGLAGDGRAEVQGWPFQWWRRTQPAQSCEFGHSFEERGPVAVDFPKVFEPEGGKERHLLEGWSVAGGRQRIGKP